MKILVTGGAGFIGSNLVDKLLAKKYEVIVIDNLNDYYDINRKKSNLKNALKNPNFKFYKCDIMDLNSLKKIFKKEKIDKIVHLAARAGVRPSLKEPIFYLRNNCEGTINLLELAKENKIKKFIFGSSSSIYGNSKQIPFSEISKSDMPISPYAATKKASELLCYVYHSLYNLEVINLRFFTVYGPRGRPDMAIYKFIDKIYHNKAITLYGDGSSKRDYTYINDIINGIMLSLDSNIKYGTYNLGNSQMIELKVLIEIIERILNKKAIKDYRAMNPGDVNLTFADLKNSCNDLGYQPIINIEEGIKRTIEWYLKEAEK
ncbi:MAG: SDR family NAD(P)-dependent oxidoreductase [Nanoarchaeota archaeon]|nr:SDR family NAD(P)-dependent oxidoreductase [Nanoarchaeota archaeon]